MFTERLFTTTLIPVLLKEIRVLTFIFTIAQLSRQQHTAYNTTHYLQDKEKHQLHQQITDNSGTICSIYTECLIVDDAQLHQRAHKFQVY